LIEAFQGVVDTLQRQEREIVALRNRRPGQESLQGPLVDNLLSGVVVADAGGAVTALNAAGQRILGVSLQDALGQHYRQVVRRSAEMVRLMDGCMQDQKGRSRVLVRVRDGKGGAGHLGASVSPLEPDGTAAAGVLCIFSDLTEIRQVEERVRLRENLAEVGHQSAGIAHEVRNALATILGYARLAARSPAEEAKEHAAAIGKEVESIQTVLADYLQFARPLSLNLERLQLGKLVREVVADLQRDAGQDGASVQVSGEFGEVEGDEVLLRQAIGNLVRNGLEAAGPDGRVALEGRMPAPGSEVILEVHDDGPGLPQGADVEDLFRPFYTTKRDGTGLGLSMVRKTVVYHDGEITADRGPWGGARFTITLPTRLQEISGSPEAERGSPGRS
jgi:PAS domain S-box-containing protein